MLAKTKKRVHKVLVEGRANGVLGLIQGDGGVAPHVFDNVTRIDSLVIEPKWLLAKLAVMILKDAPDDYRLAVICRGCDERALIELIKRHQVDSQQLDIIGFACRQAQAQKCLCTRPYPSNIDIGAAVDGVDPFEDERVQAFLGGDQRDRMQKWAAVLKRCVKCYGCRNACPICVCEPCKLEDEHWVRRGEIPADPISFHLIRAYHLSDTCVACGACQDACPEDIPLMLLQIAMRNSLARNYGYEAGLQTENRSPLFSDLNQDPAPGYDTPGWVDSLGEHHDV